MKEYELSKDVCQAIVDGTLKGYLEYLKERKLKQQTMHVSGAYAWTRGNHIDDQVAEIGDKLGLNFKMGKAGYTWEYLQFTLTDNSEKYMILVKNAQKVNSLYDGAELKNNYENYLTDLGEVNTPLLKSTSFVEEKGQLALDLGFSNNVEDTKIDKKRVFSEYSRVYIVTYEVDSDSKLIKSIILTMPNNNTMRLALISDLTSLIQKSRFEITPDDVDIIKNEKISADSSLSGSVSSYGYDIPAEEQESNKD